MTNWERDLHLIEVAYISRKHDAVGFAPFTGLCCLPLPPLMGAFDKSISLPSASPAIAKDGLSSGVAETLEKIQTPIAGGSGSLGRQPRCYGSLTQSLSQRIQTQSRRFLRCLPWITIMNPVDRLRPKNAKLLPRYNRPSKILRMKEFDTYGLALLPAMS